MSEEEVEEKLGACGWCDTPAVDIIYTEGKPGLKKPPKQAPVCFEHYKHFIARGMISRKDYWKTMGRKI